MVPRSRLPLWAYGLAGGAAAILLVLGLMVALTPRTGAQTGVVRTSGVAAIGGDFTLVDQDGATFTQDDLKGRPSLIFFGYTNCPDICPVTLQVVDAAIARLPERQRDAVQPVFVTVDPERDTVERLKAYVQTPGFPENLVGLTGAIEQVEETKSAFRVYSAKAGGGEGDFYLVDHTGLIYLMDAEGAFVAAFGHTESPEAIASAVRDAMG